MIVTLEQATTLGHVLKTARGTRKQTDVAGRIGVSAPVISRIENNTQSPSISQLALLVEEFGLDFARAVSLLVDAELKKAENNPKVAGRLRDLRLSLKQSLNGVSFSSRKPEWQSLDFRTIVVGDRRERPPRHPADILSLSADAGDLFHASQLGVPLEIWNDKVLEADAAFLQNRLSHDIVILGSPGVNLVSRKANSASCFRFRIPEQAIATEGRIRDTIGGLSPRELNDYFDRLTDDQRTELDHMWSAFRGTDDFIDPLRDSQVTNGHSLDRSGRYLYGIASFCEHLWSTRHAAFLAGGGRCPATAASLMLLTTPEMFDRRPLGGVFRIAAEDVRNWYEQPDHARPEWVTPAYTVRDFERAVADCHARGLAAYSDDFVQSMNRLTAGLREREVVES